MFKKFIRLFVLCIILPISIFMISCSSLSQSDVSDCPQNNPSITIPSDNDNTDSTDNSDSETDSENTENGNETTDNENSENTSGDEDNENNSSNENNENVENPDQSEDDNDSDNDDSTVLPPETIDPPIEDPSDEQVDENSEYNIEFQVVDMMMNNFNVNLYDNAYIINELFGSNLVNSSDGLVIYVDDEFEQYKFAFHFKNKDGKNIITSSENGKHYLIFDLYYFTPYYMFNIELNNYVGDLTFGEFNKISYKIEITENSTLSLNIM